MNIEQGFTKVIETGDAYSIWPVEDGSEAAFDLLNSDEERSLPFFGSVSKPVMSLYAAFALAAFKYGDL